MHVLTDIAHSFREAFFMFWVTLWALILGFGLSGAVQAFVSRSEMEQRLGRRGPREIVRATLFGAASSAFVNGCMNSRTTPMRTPFSVAFSAND